MDEAQGARLRGTTLIGKLGPIDRIFQTPSNHRVHHASNAEYLDKNFGGSTMIWDWLFGTYEPEVTDPVYGLTKDLDANTPWTIAKGGYPELLTDLRETDRWSDRVRMCAGAPV